MKKVYPILLALGLTAVSCQRKLSPSEVKENLERSMTEFLQKEQGQDTPPRNFKMVDVYYFEEADYYDCEFRVKLTRPDGSDTTGIIKSRITKDFATVTKRP
ncbi:MAG TPA: hypothetical protein VL727_15440 [Puia sp.]|jgi:hypothetical protein|nr:hypothetical protein [Puia sp.]